MMGGPDRPSPLPLHGLAWRERGARRPREPEYLAVRAHPSGLDLPEKAYEWLGAESVAKIEAVFARAVGAIPRPAAPQ